jgi:hypothetical protein
MANRRKDVDEAIGILRTTSPTIKSLVASQEQKRAVPPAAPTMTVDNFDEKIESLKRDSLASAKILSVSNKKAKIDPESFIKKKIAKYFETEDEGGQKVMSLFFGTVIKYVQKTEWWHVEYEDGDNEDMSFEELAHHLKLYESNKSLDTNRNTN